MTTAHHAPEAGTSRTSLAVKASDSRRTGLYGASTVLLGNSVSLLGISWDIQWHEDVGPDTFFTLPHLLLYSGSAIAGLASLAMVLIATSAQRAGRRMDPVSGGRPVRVLGGVFRAPLGYLVTGTGSAMFLLFGLLDLWWHSLYGFDAVLDSPPHVGLFLSISTSMAGSLIVFAAARGTRWGVAGLVVGIPVLITFGPLSAAAFDSLSLPFDPRLVGAIMFTVLLLLTAVFTTGRQNIVWAIAVTMGAMQAFLWWFSPVAAHAYAASVGLPLRDNLDGEAPTLPSNMPMFLLVASAVVVALWRLGRKQGWSGRIVPQLMGTAAGAVVGASLLVQNALLESESVAPVELLLATVVGALTGVLCGYLAARFSVLLREDVPTTVPATTPAVATKGL
ncbi:hypothetical protein ACFSUJ_30500 [Streptomyces lusitanus]|uniref:Uncharacterized protein n=1 Tax=Streptomyces lusitanus TaxID=68232 RepID=A0ABU3JNP7_9ACTN|nr:hypothetical protein [Streptomyces lusitanus]